MAVESSQHVAAGHAGPEREPFAAEVGQGLLLRKFRLRESPRGQGGGEGEGMLGNELAALPFAQENARREGAHRGGEALHVGRQTLAHRQEVALAGREYLEVGPQREPFRRLPAAGQGRAACRALRALLFPFA